MSIYTRKSQKQKDKRIFLERQLSDLHTLASDMEQSDLFNKAKMHLMPMSKETQEGDALNKCEPQHF